MEPPRVYERKKESNLWILFLSAAAAASVILFFPEKCRLCSPPEKTVLPLREIGLVYVFGLFLIRKYSRSAFDFFLSFGAGFAFGLLGHILVSRHFCPVCIGYDSFVLAAFLSSKPARKIARSVYLSCFLAGLGAAFFVTSAAALQ